MNPTISVVGGGPAGVVTALHAAGAGMNVRVFDRRTPPIDKPCGEGLMPSAVCHLRDLGVDVADRESYSFRGIRYREGEYATSGTFHRQTGWGCRRTVLHQNLVDRLAETAVDVHWGERVIEARPGELHTDRTTYGTDWIVGADGLHSRVRNWMGVSTRRRTDRRFGTVRHYGVDPWTDRVEVYWGRDYEAYVTPVARREVCVAMLHGPERDDFEDMLASLPRLRDRLSGAPVTVGERGWGPLFQQPAGVIRNKMALVGDASGYRDAITGEGLSLAFEQARAFVECLRSGYPNRYQRDHGRISRLPNRLVSLVTLFRNRPGLRSTMIRLLGSPSPVISYLVNLNDRGAAFLPRFIRSLVPLPIAG